MVIFILKHIVVLCLIFSGATTIYLATEKASQNQKWLLLMLICSFFCELSYFYEIRTISMVTMVSTFKVGYSFKCLSLLCFLQFISHYCNIPISKKINSLIIAFCSAMVALMMTNSYHHLVYQNEKIGTDFFFPYMDYKAGFIYYLFIYGMGVIIVLCDVMLFIRIRESKGLERRRLNYLFMSGTIPVVGLVIQKSMPVGKIDFVTIGFAFSCVILVILVKKYGLLDMVMVAKEAIVENTKEGLIVVDQDYHIQYANPAVLEYYPAIYDIASNPDNAEEFRQMFEQEEKVYENNGMYCEIRVSKLYEDKNFRGYMAWIFDMTFINNYTNEILKLKDEAERANNAKTTFLANMSHEIRTPMNAILGFAELILQHENKQETREYAYDIKRSAKSLLHIINEVLDISKIEAGKMDIINEVYYTQSLLEDVSLMIANQAEEKGLHYEADIDHNIPYQMRGPVGPLREILVNILTNAVKYTHAGSVRFVVTCIEKNGKNIVLKFTAKDTGIGMHQEEQDKLFDKFSQFNSKSLKKIEGTGLGMSIVKALAEQIGGTITVDSTFGVGTTISMEISQEIVNDRPIGDVDFNLQELEDSEAHHEFMTKAKILVVDDNETNLRVTSGLLKKYGIIADTAEDGYHAIDMVTENHYDLVFMDHMMPGIDGVETMQRIKEMQDGAFQNIPIVALTANAISGIKEQMLSIGFQGYLSKPIDITKLEQILLQNLPAELVTIMDVEESYTSDFEEEPLVINSCKHINVEEGIHNCGGSKEDYLQVLEVVHKHGYERIDRLTRMMDEKDYKNYTIDVHALKSTAANIGAMELSKMALAEEMAGKEGNYEFLQQNYEELLALYEVVLEEIEQILSDGREVQQGYEEDILYGEELPTGDETISKEELLDILQSIHERMDTFDFESAEKILQELKSFALTKEVEEGTKDALDALQKLDITKATELLENLKNIV